MRAARSGESALLLLDVVEVLESNGVAYAVISLPLHELGDLSREYRIAGLVTKLQSTTSSYQRSMETVDLGVATQNRLLARLAPCTGTSSATAAGHRRLQNRCHRRCHTPRAGGLRRVPVMGSLTRDRPGRWAVIRPTHRRIGD